MAAKIKARSPKLPKAKGRGKGKAKAKAKAKPPRAEVPPPQALAGDSLPQPPLANLNVKSELVIPALQSPPPAKAAGTKTKGTSSPSYHQAKAKWYRSLPDFVDPRTQTPRGRMPDTFAILPEIHAKICSSKAEAAHWFEVFRANGCQWQNVDIEEEVSEVATGKDGSTWQWVTRSQYAQLLGNQELADRKCDIAERDPDRFQVDPDCPDVKAGYQYWMKVFEGTKDTKAKSSAKRAKFRHDVTDEEAYLVARGLAPAKSKASVLAPKLPSPPASSSSKAADPEAEAKAEAEALEAKAAAEAEKQIKAKAKAKAKAELEASPAFQLKKWMSGIANMMLQCTAEAARAKAAGAKSPPMPMANNYENMFVRHQASLKETREELESKSPEDSNINEKLAEANALISAVNADFKAFRMLHNGYYPPSKASGKASGGASTTEQT